MLEAVLTGCAIGVQYCEALSAMALGKAMLPEGPPQRGTVSKNRSFWHCLLNARCASKWSLMDSSK